MCRYCLLELRPDRQRFVSESGAYTLNYAGCFVCSGGVAGKDAQPLDASVVMKKQPLKVKNRLVEETEDDDDGEYKEEITYEHICSICSHVIAEHYYSFCVNKTIVDESGEPIEQNKEKDEEADDDEEKPEGKEAEAAADAAAAENKKDPLTRITHDYYMECILCGKGMDEQNHVHLAVAPPLAASSLAASESASSWTPPELAPKSLSMANLQIRAPPAASSSSSSSVSEEKKKAEEDEWA